VSPMDWVVDFWDWGWADEAADWKVSERSARGRSTIRYHGGRLG
jgi:hypothetical protein